jgi:hypothetical protein
MLAVLFVVLAIVRKQPKQQFLTFFTGLVSQSAAAVYADVGIGSCLSFLAQRQSQQTRLHDSLSTSRICCSRVSLFWL